MQLLNFFLTGLAPADVQALSSSMMEMSLVAGGVLYEPGDEIGSVYFPSSACISILTVMEGGKEVETATIGRESVVALIEVMTTRPSRSRIVAQIGGGAIRLPSSIFRARLRESQSLMSLSLRHVLGNAAQAEQAAACNATHGVQARLARWLLMTQDRVGADAFNLTQDYMAAMTGVQRSTVSVMASELKRVGAIDYSRGGVRVLDRGLLLTHACECYGVVREQFDALRTGLPPER